MALSARVALVGLISCVASAAWAQQTIYVNGTTGDDTWDGLCEEWDGDTCGPKGTIQAGIDAAVDGDTVVVADGIYTGDGNKELDFEGRAITVVSDNGPETCIIDCEGDGRGFYFHTGEGADSVVDGFTIRNGFAVVGGAIRCENSSSPTITNCTIKGSSATAYGGGFHCWTGSPTITNCRFSGNRAGSGGSISFRSGAPTITGCTITGNMADGSGGGVYCYSNSSPTITRCTITANCTAGDGGGVGFQGGDPTMTANTISGNLAGGGGGGVYCLASSPTITNCVVAGNSAGAGGGVYCYNNSSPTITHCTLGGNSASDGGGGLHCHVGSPTITNCILWEDTPQEIYVYSGTPVVTYCDVQGGWDGAGNIDAAPEFAFEEDLHLMAASPCIDSGTNNPPGDPPAEDPDGNPRPLDGDGDASAVADMGAYEFNPDSPSIALSPFELSFYGQQDGPSPDAVMLAIRNCGGTTLSWQAAEGCSWLSVSPTSGQSAGEVDEVTVSIDTSGLLWGEHRCVLEVTDELAVNSPRRVTVTLNVNRSLQVPAEYETIQAAIDATIDGDTVLVADGTYASEGNSDLDLSGKAITVRSENGSETCIIDCEGAGRGFHFHTSEGPDSVVDGLAIRNGLADYGGGIYCECLSSPTITNCMISENSAAYGGGIYCCSGNPTITNCTIRANRAIQRGGGVSSYDNSPVLSHCTISGNSAGREGGGLYCYSSSPVITNCIIWGDTLPEIFVYQSSPTVTYCNVQGGWAGEGNIDSDPEFAFEDDERLMAGSLCIDAGTNTPPGGLPSVDPDGNPRPLDGDGDASAVADIGAYEFNPGGPSIALSPPELRFYGPRNGPNPAGQVLSIRNCGGTTLGWQVVESCSWLSVFPSSGESAGDVDDVTVSVDTSGLDWGAYRCVLEVSDEAAVNSPRWVTVVLYVNETLHVPADYGTIQSGIDAAIDGDTVLVAAGTHTGEGNKDLDFGRKVLTVRGENGPDACIIDCEGSGRGFYFHSGEGMDSVIDGFTLRNGLASHGGGVYCDHCSSPTITNCRIHGSSASLGGGVYCASSSPVITNCNIASNSAGEGGGVYCREFSNPMVTNCAISRNVAEDGAGVYCYSSSAPTITSSIVWDNLGSEIYASASSAPVVGFSDVEGGWPGEGNIDADPLFVDPDGPDDDPDTWEDNDYRLSAGSPCIDTGNNDALPPDAPDLDGDGDTGEPIPVDLDGHARILNGTVDMGAYEFGIGDFDGNQVVDLLDFASWDDCMMGPGGEPYAPGCEAFDFEYDSDVDLADFVGFQAAFAQP